MKNLSGCYQRNVMIVLFYNWRLLDLTHLFQIFAEKLQVELHVHLDGSFDNALLFEYLKSSSKSKFLPEKEFCPWDGSTTPVRALVEECQNLTRFHSLCTCRGKQSLNEMFKCFQIFTPIVKGDLDFVEKLAYDFVKRQAEQNVIYTEVRYNPHLLGKDNSVVEQKKEEATVTIVEPDPVVDAVTRGLRKGEKEYGVKVNQILCCIAWKPEWSSDIVRICHERRHDAPCAVVGLDIAAGEEHFDKDNYPHLHKPHLRAFEDAKKLKLNITIHAGEVGETNNIKKAIDSYGAKRIGHGYRIVKEGASLINEMREKNIHFEVCPTSSLETGGWILDDATNLNWKNHPVVFMIKSGMKVGLNSDDPAVFNTSLTWQYRIAIKNMGLTKECILQTIQDSINAAFLSEDEKTLLKKRLQEFEKASVDSFQAILKDDYIERIL